MKKQTKGFTLVELLVVIGILGILMGALFPAITSAMLRANMSAFGMKGRNLFVGIINANTEREAAGKPSVWPRSQSANTGSEDDIADKSFSTPEDYFTELFDLENMSDASKWSSYVQGVDIGVLSGCGVTPVAGGVTKFDAKNVGWSIASNVQDEMEDIVPVLLSRNMSASSLIKGGQEYNGTTDTKVELGSEGGRPSTPFSNKAYVLIRKGGAVVNMTAKYATLQTVYNKQTFKIPDAGESEGTFDYLESK